MGAKLVWITPHADDMVGYLARVSNPAATPGAPSERLIAYLIKHEHWSPFEMVSACVEIETTRDIARQILRHRSFHFQEFSQRYAAVDQTEPSLRSVRLQDSSNRQNSIEVTDDPELALWWELRQKAHYEHIMRTYQEAIRSGIAKEVARAILPEGLTNTKMYMAGTIRDWLHYLRVRSGNGTQKEHQLVAGEIFEVLTQACPDIFRAAQQGGFDFGAG